MRTHRSLSRPTRCSALLSAHTSNADGVDDEHTRADYERYLTLTRTPLREISDGDAQASHVIALKNLLTPDEVQLVLDLAEHAATSDPSVVFDRSSWSWPAAPDSTTEYVTPPPHWQVVFLQANHLLQTHLPAVARKLAAAARSVDAGEQWNATCGMSDAQVGIRCAEVHTQTRGGGLPDPQHRDHGSLITVDVMLSDSAAFEGGEFATYGPTGEKVHHAFERGTGLVFLSLKRHGVEPVLSGVRKVLVLEFWQGANVAAAGRDESHRWFGLERDGADSPAQ